MRYFPLLYRLNAQDRYLIWITNEKQSVVVDAEGLVPSFKDLVFLREYADLNHYSLESEEPGLHDLDWVATWTRSPVAPSDCREALLAWNLFIDVAASVGDRGTNFEDLDSQRLAIYQKLFWGNNLPSVTPEGAKYVPEWSPDEIDSLAEILSLGLGLFAACTRNWSEDP